MRRGNPGDGQTRSSRSLHGRMRSRPAQSGSWKPHQSRRRRSENRLRRSRRSRRGQSPARLLEGLGRAYSGRGGAGCSVAEEQPGRRGEWYSNCGHDLGSVPRGKPCPQCGETRRTYGVELKATARGVASMSWVHVGERVREYRERHPVWFIINVVLALGSPFLGLWLVGWWGVVVGILGGLLSLWVGERASVTVQ